MQVIWIVLFLFVDDALSEKVDIKNKTKQTIRHNDNGINRDTYRLKVVIKLTPCQNNC